MADTGSVCKVPVPSPSAKELQDQLNLHCLWNFVVEVEVSMHTSSLHQVKNVFMDAVFECLLMSLKLSLKR